MTKCDFCKHSHLENGKMVCPFLGCILTSSNLEEIYRVIANMKK